LAKINIEELVAVYQEVLNFDKKTDDLRVYIFKDKHDLMKKYVEENLLQMKLKEPITGEKYDNKFKEFLEEIRVLSNTFSNDEIIIIGVYGKYVDSINIHDNDIRLYHISEISLLADDIKEYYR